FLIGSWDDIIDASIKISNRFKSFTLGKLTLSAGVGMFPSKYPISKMAFETGILEEFAKTGDKNQIALWRDDKVMTWRELEDE
ncbi:Cas10/Cmr2 second palm domain-containing protein, partial [Staphylococcus saprophyticus]|uniref:Cas10/Cmr2 second palm domain-containing protein n=2 Tax=Staphylococcaceae TaxID=90964 RepID=UPI003F68A9A5